MKIAKDKVLHFCLGVILMGIFVTAFSIDVEISLLLTIIAGIAKEVYDYVSGKGKPEFLDALATAIGGILMAILYLAIGG